jgi:hypothetical protein
MYIICVTHKLSLLRPVCTTLPHMAAAQTESPHPCAGDSAKPLLAHFLEGLLRRLLLEAAGRDAIEAAADCLLALILAAPDTFRSLGALRSCFRFALLWSFCPYGVVLNRAQ